MEKCSPVDMRKNLEAVEVMKSNGIDFVPIPVGGNLTKEVLIQMMASQFDELEKMQNKD